MKKFLFIIVMLVSAQAIAHDTTKLTVNKVYEDVKVGVKDAIGGIKELAGKLEGPAKHVYHVYINQHRIIGLSKLISTMLFTLFFGIMAFRLFGKCKFENNNDTMKEEVFFILSCIGFVIAGICAAFYFGGDFNKLLNPEYYAIQDVLNAFK